MTELFKNSHDALTFAFNYSTQQYAQSPMSKMLRGPGTGTGKGLYALDGAGQAGLIRAQVAKLSPTHRACVVARYSPRHAECACCGSRDRILPEYKEAIATLGQWALSAFSGLSARVAREYVIRSYYERGLSLRIAVEHAGVSKSALYDYKSKIIGKLKDIDHVAQAEIDASLLPLLDQ